ncbi:MAG: MerR family transcriptional regulator [Cytophagaceae bacterium]
MSLYSIADLEKLSGVKAHTIRIWEQRYALLTPLRSATNIRYYDDAELRKLLRISTLINNGFRISEISKLSEEQINQELDRLIETSQAGSEMVFIHQLIDAGINYDESGFKKVFNSCLKKHGIISAYIKVIYPMLERIGMLWTKEDIVPAQEHFISNLIRQKLFTAIDGLPLPKDPAATYVLFLPEEEEHEIGLLIAAYLLRRKGIQVIYLGQRVPLANLMLTVSSCQATHIMSFFVHRQKNSEAQKYINMLSSEFDDLKIIIAGNAWLMSQLHIPENILWISSVKQFEDHLVSYA